MFSNDIGIDLGTATTLIYVAGKGIVLKEPSIVAMDARANKVMAVGQSAYEMLGKTSDLIRVVRPLEEGVISDYEVTEEMLKYFFKKVSPSKFFKPRVCVCVPSAITEVESRAVIDTMISAGARNVFLIEEPVAAAIGAGIDITVPGGVAILDIGGGTSDIAVLSLNGIVCKTSLKMAGNTFNQAIIKYIRSTYNVLIGDNTADRIKRDIATVWPEDSSPEEYEVKGRNLVTGLPQRITITNQELMEPLAAEVEHIILALQSVLERTPPELVADIEQSGLIMTGGGSMLGGMDKLISSRIRIQARLAENPVEAVAIGTGLSFDYLGKLYDGFVTYTNYSSK
ncbi:MAG: rod shape-determining protein [Angelakisella sp.]|nr:rod shape-determining protein [Angelakisella sp.]